MAVYGSNFYDISPILMEKSGDGFLPSQIENGNSIPYWGQ
jgi:hypothetical protein